MPHALAVDDDPNFLSALAELIEGQGFTTNIACTLRDARAQVSHRRSPFCQVSTTAWVMRSTA